MNLEKINPVRSNPPRADAAKRTSNGIKFKQDVDLGCRTSIKIGGRAGYFFEAGNEEALERIINDSSSFYILGNGSNLLIKDKTIKKPVVKLGQEFSYVKQDDNYLEVGALTLLSFLIKYCLENNLAGLENLAGIPASIGGLLCMNASSFAKDISSCLESVDVIDKKGQPRTFKKDEIVFGYRYSSLEDYIILRAKFNLSLGKDLKQRVRSFLSKRLSGQDFSFPSCGCIFKNPSEFSAGYLIEACGLKGLKKGGAQVSHKHANFIINIGGAKYNDVDYLIKKIKDRVYKKYKLVLSEEIKRWA
ncbi:MAG: UDP-N-acetylmuramate dehydrogenase [Candidatus Omnitrophota bacterium]